MKEFIKNLESAQCFKRYSTIINGIDIRGNLSIMHEKVLEFSEEEISSLEAHWDATELQNKEIRISNIPINKQAKKDAEVFCDAIGIDTWKYRSGRATNDKYKEFKAICDKIDSKAPLFSQYSRPAFKQIRVGNKVYDTNARTLSEVIASVKNQIHTEKQKEQSANKLFQKSVAEAHKYGIDPLREDIVNAVYNAALEEFLEKEYPDGETVDISICDECSNWTVGERRCGCGNTKVCLDWEGDILNGFSAWLTRF